MYSNENIAERTWAVVHSLMKLNGPVPPKLELVSRTPSPSLAFPLNHPTVSRPGNAMRIGGPLSQVANARPSWYSIDVFATLIFLMACCEPGRCESTTSMMVLRIRKTMVVNVLMGLTRVAMLGKIGVLRRAEVLDEL